MVDVTPSAYVYVWIIGSYSIVSGATRYLKQTISSKKKFIIVHRTSCSADPSCFADLCLALCAVTLKRGSAAPGREPFYNIEKNDWTLSTRKSFSHCLHFEWFYPSWPKIDKKSRENENDFATQITISQKLRCSQGKCLLVLLFNKSNSALCFMFSISYSKPIPNPSFPSSHPIHRK